MSEENSYYSPAPSQGETIIEVSIQRLKRFPNHPFRVKDDEAMDSLMESIRQFGILMPLVVRPTIEGCYEIISGHRRKRAAERLGYEKVPVIIRALKDEDSIIGMVDSNLQRDKILPSEKAFAYKMKNDALKRKYRPPSKTDIRSIDYKSKYRITVEELGLLGGDSGRQVQRYIRLTFLIPELLEMVDDGRMGFNPSVQISFLSNEEQKIFLEALLYTQSSPSLSQAIKLKEISQNSILTLEKAINILSEEKKGVETRLSFKSEQLYQYFPKDYTTEQIREEILDLLRLHGKQLQKEKGGE